MKGKDLWFIWQALDTWEKYVISLIEAGGSGMIGDFKKINKAKRLIQKERNKHKL